MRQDRNKLLKTYALLIEDKMAAEHLGMLRIMGGTARLTNTNGSCLVCS